MYNKLWNNEKKLRQLDYFQRQFLINFIIIKINIRKSLNDENSKKYIYLIKILNIYSFFLVLDETCF